MSFLKEEKDRIKMSQIIIKQIRSSIGIKPNQKATLKALGLRKINHVKQPAV